MILTQFNPQSPCYVIPANSVAPSGIHPKTFNGSISTQVQITNTGSQMAYLAWGADAATAAANAVVPAAGSPANVIPIPVGSAIYTLPVGVFFSAITPGATLTNLLLILGEGA